LIHFSSKMTVGHKKSIIPPSQFAIAFPLTRRIRNQIPQHCGISAN